MARLSCLLFGSKVVPCLKEVADEMEGTHECKVQTNLTIAPMRSDPPKETHFCEDQSFFWRLSYHGAQNFPSRRLCRKKCQCWKYRGKV
jgi:hypothetical protein